MPDLYPYLLPVLQIIGIDLLLSGDNAVVIALACRGLPPQQRRMGILLGSGVAIGLRLVFAVLTTELLAFPWLKAVGAVLLLWIGVKLAAEDSEQDEGIASPTTLWSAVRTVAIADLVMSFDNVVAIAAAAHGNAYLLVFGLLLSIPLVILGSTLVLGLLRRYPVLIWFGAALLGSIAGGMLLDDPSFVAFARSSLEVVVPATIAGLSAHLWAQAAGAALVVGLGLAIKRRRPERGSGAPAAAGDPTVTRAADPS